MMIGGAVMIKRLTAFFMAFIMVLVVAVPSFATPSNAMPLSVSTSSASDVLTYADDVWLGMYYYDMSNNTKQYWVRARNDGAFKFSKPDDFVSAFRFVIMYDAQKLKQYINKTDYPNADIPLTFTYNSHFSMNVKSDSIRYAVMYSYSSQPQFLTKIKVSSADENGTVSLAQSVTVNISYAWVGFAFDVEPIRIPFGGGVQLVISDFIGFDYYYFGVGDDGTSPVDPSVPPPTDVGGGLDIDIDKPVVGADSSDIIYWLQYISAQISAFWDQLAGAFTSQFSWLSAIHDKIGSGDGSSAVVDSIDNGVDNIIDNDNSNTQDIINSNKDNVDMINQNQNENSDKMINGYDNSGINSDNDRLNEKLEEVGSAENEVIDQISKPIGDFTFDNPLVQYLNTFQLFGNFMQSVFTGSGAFKDVINMSFSMGIALMVAGLYRFKGGN